MALFTKYWQIGPNICRYWMILCLKRKGGNNWRNLSMFFFKQCLLVVLHMLLKSSVPLHINCHLKGRLHAQRSPHCVPEEGKKRRGEGLWLFFWKGFLFHSSEKAESRRITAVFCAWRNPQLVTVFHVELVRSLNAEGVALRAEWQWCHLEMYRWAGLHVAILNSSIAGEVEERFATTCK